MAQKNSSWLHVLNGLSIVIILLTGALEFQNPQGGFLLWGYIVGILLTIITNKRVYIISAFILSVIFILISFSQISKDEAIEKMVLTQTYEGVGLAITLLFVLVAMVRERKTAKVKAQMAAIFSHGIQGIILFKEDGSIVLVNPFTEKMFGYPSDQLVGKKINVLIPELLPLGSHQPTDTSKRGEWIAQSRNQDFFPVEISLNQYESKGKWHTVAFVTDITSRKKNEEILHAQKKELEMVNKELEAFSYSVSHDLRSPLRAVGGYAQMLEEDYGSLLDEEAKRLLKNIQKSALRMGSLIDDLLSFSKLGRKELNKTLVNMEELSRQALMEVNQSNTYNAAVLIGPVEPVQADYSLLLNVMVNLISNALKYSSKNSAPRVEINSISENGNVIYSVSDNGVGFDMQYVNKLFGVFQRLHGQKEFEGTGVGLATAQRIIHKHGGKIWAEGKEGVGATFSFSIPAMQITDQRKNFNHGEDSATSFQVLKIKR